MVKVFVIWRLEGGLTSAVEQLANTRPEEEQIDFCKGCKRDHHSWISKRLPESMPNASWLRPFAYTHPEQNEVYPSEPIIRDVVMSGEQFRFFFWGLLFDAGLA